MRDQVFFLRQGIALVLLWVIVAHVSFARPPMNQPSSMAAAAPVAPSRPDRSPAEPYMTVRVHDAGNIELPITNWGIFGSPGPRHPLIDPKTGETLVWVEFWSGKSRARLNMGALWVGALVETMLGDDTLVSTGHNAFVLSEENTWLTEFYPESYAGGADFTERSNEISSVYYDPEAVSVQDFLCMYADTLTNPEFVRPDFITAQLHRPLQVRVRQGSFVWPYEYGEDFMIIQYQITNMRDQPLHEVRVGILVVPRSWSTNENQMVGFLRTAPSITGYKFDDTVMAAWSATHHTVRGVMGLRFLGVGRSPCDLYADSLEYSFNWWAPASDTRMDWGPQRRPSDRSVKGGYGQPLGDAQKYRYMANGEIDYDQHLANEKMPGWIPPLGEKEFFSGPFNIADGHNVRYLLAVGPFELGPGDSISIAVAVAGGDLLHRDPENRRNLGANPDEWYMNLDFSDLGRNLQWAAWVYDNPGVDTDSDGCAGAVWTTNCRDTVIFYEEYCFIWPDTVICVEDYWSDEQVCDSVYYAGDGVPDLKGPPPPPSPKISIHSEPQKIHIRWSGRESELYFDSFAQREDFEGYNVYGGLGNDPKTLNLMASWDLVNYDRYRYIAGARPSPWVLNEPPLTLEHVYRIYGLDFDPALYTDHLSYFEDDQGNHFYFKPHGGNRGNEYIEAGRITTNRIQYVRTDSLWDENKQSWKLFGHYECSFDNLLPSQPYYFAVTAFDYGLAAGNLGPLESAPQANMQLAYPTYSPDYVEENRLKVSVYPNPYKIDAGYRQSGFEDPNREGFKERTRRIHFVNLPPKATIKIFSLDGDLIRELHHPESRFSDTPSHTAWDLITRNTQAVVSGIYLYSVESEWGTQIGKIVIIK